MRSVSLNWEFLIRSAEPAVTPQDAFLTPLIQPQSHASNHLFTAVNTEITPTVGSVGAQPAAPHVRTR